MGFEFTVCSFITFLLHRLKDKQDAFASSLSSVWMLEARNIVLSPSPVCSVISKMPFLLVLICVTVFAFHNDSCNFMVLPGPFSLFFIILFLLNRQPLAKLTEKQTPSPWDFWDIVWSKWSPDHSVILSHGPQSQILFLIWKGWGRKLVPCH